MVKFVNSKYNGVIPAPSSESDSVDDKLLTEVNHLLREYHHSMESIKISASIKVVMDISRLGNGYLQVSFAIFNFV